MDEHERFMREALKEARKAFDKEECPIGCVIVYEGKIIARAIICALQRTAPSVMQR